MFSFIFRYIEGNQYTPTDWNTGTGTQCWNTNLMKGEMSKAAGAKSGKMNRKIYETVSD